MNIGQLVRKITEEVPQKKIKPRKSRESWSSQIIQLKWEFQENWNSKCVEIFWITFGNTKCSICLQRIQNIRSESIHYKNSKMQSIYLHFQMKWTKVVRVCTVLNRAIIVLCHSLRHTICMHKMLHCNGNKDFQLNKSRKTNIIIQSLNLYRKPPLSAIFSPNVSLPSIWSEEQKNES